MNPNRPGITEVVENEMHGTLNMLQATIYLIKGVKGNTQYSKSINISHIQHINPWERSSIYEFTLT
jgi:hypothetical protein